MRVEWVEGLDGFDELAAQWERLADEATSPFARHAWFRSWWRAFGTGRLAVATAWEGEELVAGLPLLRAGRALRALANEHTPVFEPVGSGAGLAAVVDAAVAASPSVLLREVTAAGVRDALRSAAHGHRRLPLEQCVRRLSVVRLEDDWETYRHHRDRRWRKDIERRGRRLDEELAPSYLVLEEPVDVDAQLAEGFRAEASGWKGRQGSAIRDDPRALQFYGDVARAFAAAGRFRISAIVHADRYVAFDYCIVDHARIWIPKGGFDEDFRRFAPGLVLTLLQIEAAFGLGADAVELLGEPVPWKARLATEFRDQWHTGAYAHNPVPLFEYAGRRAWPHARMLYRRIRPPR